MKRPIEVGKKIESIRAAQFTPSEKMLVSTVLALTGLMGAYISAGPKDRVNAALVDMMQDLANELGKWLATLPPSPGDLH